MGQVENSGNRERWLGDDTTKPQTISASANTATDIYSYNKITLHYSKGAAGVGGTMVLTNNGCMHNGQPQWDFEDGVYDGDWDTVSGKGKHKHRHHHSDRFGSSVCEGKSHKLRWAAGDKCCGWEFITHGYITSFTTATTLNFFSIQGSGDTSGIESLPPSNIPGAAGRWINSTGATDNFPFGRFRINAITYDVGGVTGITTNGIIS